MKIQDENLDYIEDLEDMVDSLTKEVEELEAENRVLKDRIARIKGFHTKTTE